MSEDLNDLITCKLNSRDKHLIKSPRAINCGHSYCLRCLSEEFLQNQCIFCPICKKNVYIDTVQESVQNLFFDQIFTTFPKIYTDVLKRHQDAISDIKNVSLLKFDEFFDFQLEEIEIKKESLLIEIEQIELQMLEYTKKLEKKLRKINQGFKIAVDFSNSRSAFSERDFAKCETLLKLAANAYHYHNLFTADANSLVIIHFNGQIDDLTLKRFGNIKKTINLNTRRFKKSRYRVHEYSNYLSSIGDICKLDDEHYVATNPVGDSLAVFEERTLKIIKTITNIKQTRFSYPMAICSNNDNVYVCDCHNLRVLILNKELDVVRNMISTLYHPTDICFDSNHLYVLYSDRKSLHKLTSDGVLKTRFELKPTKLASHSEIDPIRMSIQNTKAVVLYSNNKVFIHDIIENQKLVDNPKEIEKNIMITGICYSSPFLLTIQDDGSFSFYDLINQFNNEKDKNNKDDAEDKYKCIPAEEFRVFSRATPCFVTYFDECLFITFKNPNSHWLMKFDIK